MAVFQLFVEWNNDSVCNLFLKIHIKVKLSDVLTTASVFYSPLPDAWVSMGSPTLDIHP